MALEDNSEYVITRIESNQDVRCFVKIKRKKIFKFFIYLKSKMKRKLKERHLQLKKLLWLAIFQKVNELEIYLKIEIFLFKII